MIVRKQGERPDGGCAARPDGKDFSGGGKRQYFTWKRHPPVEKTGSIFFKQKSLIHRKISVTIKEQMFLVRHVSGYGATELIKRK